MTNPDIEKKIEEIVVSFWGDIPASMHGPLRHALQEMYEMGLHKEFHLLSCAHCKQIGAAEMKKRILETLGKAITETKRYYNEKAPDKCGLCWEDEFCYHKYQRNALEEVSTSIESLPINPNE